MKNFNPIALAILVFAASFPALAKDYNQRLNRLGVSKEVMKKAENLDPNNSTAVVQGRTVSRDLRFEIGLNYGAVASGGDPYYDTKAIGGMLDFHINPMFSVGARYQSYDNDLNAEGDRVFKNADSAKDTDNQEVPDLDHPIDSYMGVVSFYPFYGKLNLFNSAIAQFDIYLLGGYGQMNLESGSTGTYTGGLGLGAWISQHFVTRLEVRYQGYQDQIESGARDINWTMITGNIGILL